MAIRDEVENRLKALNGDRKQLAREKARVQLFLSMLDDPKSVAAVVDGIGEIPFESCKDGKWTFVKNLTADAQTSMHRTIWFKGKCVKRVVDSDTRCTFRACDRFVVTYSINP